MGKPDNELEYLRARVKQLEEALKKERTESKKPINGLDDSVFPHLIDSIGDFVLITNEKGEIHYVNQAIIEKFGYSRKELIGANAGIFIEPASRSAIGREILTTTSNGAWHGELDNITKEGIIFRSSLKTSGFKTASGATYFIAISHDISRRYTAEQKLLFERELLQNLMDSMPDSIYFKDENSKFTRVNKVQADILGLESPEDAVGLSDFDFFEEVHAREAFEDELKIIKTGKPLIAKPEYIRIADGSHKWVSASKAPYTDNTGKITGILGISRDITSERLALQRLSENEALLEGVINGMSDIIIIRDLSLKPIKLNTAAKEFFETEKSNSKNQRKNHVLKLLTSTKNAKSATDSGAPLICEISDPFSNRYYECRTTPVTDRNNEIFLIIEQIRDISEQKTSSNLLTELYNRFAQITSQLPGMVYQFARKPDKTFVLLYANSYIEEIFSHSLIEIQQNPDLLFKNIHSDDIEYFISSIHESAENLSPWVTEFRLNHPTKGLIWVGGSSEPTHGEDGSIIWHGFITNITKDKQTENDIKETHKNLEATLNAIPDLLFELDEKGVIYNYHAPSEGQLYIKPDFFVNRKVSEILPDQACSQILKAIKEADENGVSSGIQYELPDGNKSSWFELNISVKETTPEGKRFLALVRDTTSRKIAELQLEHQSRVLESVAQATTTLLVEEDSDRAINKAFEILGNASQADRIYLFEYHNETSNPETRLISQRFEWCAPGIEPQIGNPELQNLSADYITRWNKLFYEGHPVAGFVKDFPVNEREILEPQDIISLLVVPVFVGEGLFGFVGFDDCSKGYSWTQSETLILQSLASGIGSAILRKRAAVKLLFSENRFRVLYQESPIGLMLSDQDGIILDTNKAFRKILDCDSIDIFNTSFHKLIPPEFSAIIESAVNQLKRTGAAGPIEIRLISLKGSEIPVLMSLMLVRELDQKPRVWAIIEDISQRKKFESDLIKARDEATRANRSKSEFLANMSHEIRTPLNAIMGFSELLSEQLENSKHQEFVDIIGKSGQNLLLIINDILDLSRIEAGRLKIDPEPVKPSQILFELERIFTHSAKEKNLKFSVVKDSNLPETLIMDETRIRQVLVNLIGNAIKFTHHGEIILSVKVLDFSDDNLSCNILFEVKDTGIGIPPDQQDLIFQAFMQQEGQSTRKFGGTGLGLTITKRMLEMMNGDITVTSSPGNGSTFHVTLKAVAIAKTYTPISVSSDLVLAKSYIFHDQLILNVEDISLNRAVIKEMLKGKNLRLIEAVDGKEGLEKAIKFKPDLILMDMQMPVMDGYTATRLIKNDSEISHIPIVALTASAMKEEAELIKKLCDGYLQKPVSPGTLMSEIAKFLTYDAASEITEWEQEETGLNEISLSEVDKEPEYKTSLLLLNQLKKIREGMIIDEIIAFSIVLGKAGESSDSFKLKTFADTIKQQAESFRIDELMASFNLLSDYLTNISDS